LTENIGALPYKFILEVTMKRILVVVVIGVLLVSGTVGICAAEEPQPHMRAAIEHLREAREQLEKAEPNKGGHRERAIKLVDRAIEQVRAGIEFSEHHEHHAR
jgi:hypothetical protein